MGLSEWGIVVTSIADIELIQAVVAAHNTLGVTPEGEAEGADQNDGEEQEGDATDEKKVGSDDKRQSIVSRRDQVGEKLDIYALMRYSGKIWLCLGNEGGGSETSSYLKTHLPLSLVKSILFPHEKPKTWYACTDYVWQAKKQGDIIPIESLSCFKNPSLIRSAAAAASASADPTM